MVQQREDLLCSWLVTEKLRKGLDIELESTDFVKRLAKGDERKRESKIILSPSIGNQVNTGTTYFDMKDRETLKQ